MPILAGFTVVVGSVKNNSFQLFFFLLFISIVTVTNKIQKFGSLNECQKLKGNVWNLRLYILTPSRHCVFSPAPRTRNCYWSLWTLLNGKGTPLGDSYIERRWGSYFKKIFHVFFQYRPKLSDVAIRRRITLPDNVAKGLNSRRLQNIDTH